MPQTFRFMDLPAEIRNRIYSYALSLSFYDKAHERSFTSGHSHTTHAKQCNVLLIDRKTSDEAKAMIMSTPVTLSYGLELEMSSNSTLNPPLSSESIQHYFPASRLRNTSQLTISDVGYRDKERDSLEEKHFLGLARLVREVAEICREGHKLKHVLISFRSHLVQEYIDQLTTSEVAQKWMFEVVSSLREIRGVGKGRVILDVDIDHPSTTKEHLIADMESPHKGLLSLPNHVRQRIYGYAVDFNDAIKQMNDSHTDSPMPTTPTMLLLNRQISAEVVSYLREVPLEIYFDAWLRILMLDAYISRETVRHIKHVRLKIERDTQLKQVAEELITAWTHDNPPTFDHPSWESFELDYHEPALRKMLLERNEQYPPDNVATAMMAFSKVRSISKVKITGTLPRCFADAIKSNMMQSFECGTQHEPRYLENGIKTSSDYDEYESDSDFDPEEDYGAPKTFKEYYDRMCEGENMPEYFYTESMEAERQDEEDQAWADYVLGAAQAGLDLYPEEASESDDEFSEDDEESSEDDEESSEDDDESPEDNEE